MSRLRAYQLVDEVGGCNNIINNIFKYGLGVRQDETRTQVRCLYPFLPRWQRSRNEEGNQLGTGAEQAEELEEEILAAEQAEHESSFCLEKLLNAE